MTNLENKKNDKTKEGDQQILQISKEGKGTIEKNQNIIKTVTYLNEKRKLTTNCK